MILPYKLIIEEKEKLSKDSSMRYNIGEIAGQTVFHCHAYLIPRKRRCEKSRGGGHVINGKVTRCMIF